MSTISFASRYASMVSELEPLILAHTDHAERRRQLCNVVAHAMSRAGLYRIAAPARLGGAEAHPVTQIKTIEAISKIDGATGWNLMIGIENIGILGSVCDPRVTARIYADPELIIAGSLNPLGKAERVPGGYIVSGQWPFASGIHNAHFFWSQSILHQDGERMKDENGLILCESLVPVEEIEILDTWHVSGMRGSGSHDVKLDEVFVAEDYISHVQRARPTESGPLYRMPLYSRLAYNKVGVATGIALAAIDHFVNLATEKKPRASSVMLQHRVDAQRAVSEATRIVGSARSFVFDTVSELYSTVDQGDKPTKRQRALVQLSCSAAANESVKAVEMLVASAGASANFQSSPLERIMRNILVVRQHIMVSPQFGEAIGRVLLGMESESFLF